MKKSLPVLFYSTFYWFFSETPIQLLTRQRWNYSFAVFPDMRLSVMWYDRIAYNQKHFQETNLWSLLFIQNGSKVFKRVIWTLFLSWKTFPQTKSRWALFQLFCATYRKPLQKHPNMESVLHFFLKPKLYSGWKFRANSYNPQNVPLLGWNSQLLDWYFRSSFVKPKHPLWLGTDKMCLFSVFPAGLI